MDELVKALRETDFGDTCVLCEHEDMCKGNDCIIIQAADAIEKLQKRVPKTPHGRLIDADALTKMCREMQGIEWNKKASPYSWEHAYEEFENDIDDAPTIIPEEEGET